MTTEAVLLLGLFAFLILGVFLGDSGPRAVFNRSGPMLGARIEAQLATGQDFLVRGQRNQWVKPEGDGPQGTF